MPISKEYYYKLREDNYNNEIKRAARFIYLNRFCFNGLYRTNMDGRFNVPYGPTKTGKIPDIDSLLSLSKKLDSTEILCGDFEDIIKSNIKHNDLFYLDPPYISDSRIFSSYNGKKFTTLDHERLILLLDYIDKKGAYFILSSLHENSHIQKLKRWNCEIVSANRTISGSTNSRNKVQEMIITNF